MVERREISEQVQSLMPTEKPREPSLAQSLNGRELPYDSMLAVRIIDSLGVNLSDKRHLFFYHLWHETGSFASIKEFGEIREDPTIDSILDKVMEDESLLQKYDIFFKTNTYIQIQNKALGVFELRMKKKSSQQISQELEIPLKAVEKISKDLILIGAVDPFPKGKHKAEMFREFCDKVLYLRSQGIINYEEIATKLGSNKTNVKQAVARLSRAGLITTLSKQEMGERERAQSDSIREKIKNLRTNTKYTVEDIARILKLTQEQVRLQITILIKSGEIPSKRTQERKRRKELLRNLLQKAYLKDPKKPIEIAEIMRSRVISSDFDFVVSLYNEISNEQPVPPRQIRKKN